MNRPWSIALCVLLSALPARQAAAQWNVADFATARNRVYVTFGLDPAFVMTVGYGRVVALAGHDVQLFSEVGVVTARPDLRDFRVRLGTQTSLVRLGAVHLTGSAAFIARGTDNAIYRAFDFGSDFTGALGVYRHGWFAATEFGFDKAIITHVTQSDWYRRHIYPDAKDGWYLDAGGTYHYGLAGGLTLGRTELVGRVGQLRTERFGEMMPPMYASVGAGFKF